MGMGLSDKPPAHEYRYTLTRRVDDLETLLDSLGVTDNITLVLHDWGGMIGMTYACRHPERIARLVILNTGAFRHPKGKRLPWQIRLARTPGIGDYLVKSLNMFSRGAVKKCVTRKPMPADVRDAYLAPYNSPEHRVAVHEFVRDIPEDDDAPAWHHVLAVEAGLSQFADRPAMICWGMKDFVFDADFLDKWREVLPHAEVHRYEDAGHYILEDAAEEILPLVNDFMKREAGL